MTKTLSELIETLEQTPAILVDLTSQLGPTELDFRAGPEEWSVREILAHLVDDEIYITRLRLERIVKEDKPELTPHDEKFWYAHRNTSRDKLDELLTDFQLQRAASMGIIKMLRPEDWKRTGHQPEYDNGQFTAAEWLGHWADHDLNHIAQIKANLAGVK